MCAYVCSSPFPSMLCSAMLCNALQCSQLASLLLMLTLYFICWFSFQLGCAVLACMHVAVFLGGYIPLSDAKSDHRRDQEVHLCYTPGLLTTPPFASEVILDSTVPNYHTYLQSVKCSPFISSNNTLYLYYSCVQLAYHPLRYTTKYRKLHMHSFTYPVSAEQHSCRRTII